MVDEETVGFRYTSSDYCDRKVDYSNCERSLMYDDDKMF